MFGFRLPLRPIWEAILFRFRHPLVWRPVSGANIVNGFSVFRIIARAIMSRFKTRYWSSYLAIVVDPVRFALRRDFSDFVQSPNEISFHHSGEKRFDLFDYLSVLKRPGGPSLTCHRLGPNPVRRIACNTVLRVAPSTRKRLIHKRRSYPVDKRLSTCGHT